MKYFLLILFSCVQLCAVAQKKQKKSVKTAPIVQVMDSVMVDTVYGVEMAEESLVPMSSIDSDMQLQDTLATLHPEELESDSLLMVHAEQIEVDTVLAQPEEIELPKNPENIYISNTMLAEYVIQDAELSDITIENATVLKLVILNSTSDVLTITNASITHLIIKESILHDALIEDSAIGEIHIECSKLVDFSVENSMIRKQTIIAKKPKAKASASQQAIEQSSTEEDDED